MIINIKKLGTTPIDLFTKKVSTLACSALLKFIVQFVIIIIFAKKLSLTDYAQYQYIWMFINFFSICLLFGFSQLILSYSQSDILFFFKRNNSKIILAIVAITSTALIFLYFFSPALSIYQKVLLFIILLFQCVCTVFESIAIKNNSLKKLFFANIVYMVLYSAVHFYAYTHYNVTYLLIGVLIATFFKSLLIFQKSSVDISTTSTEKKIGTQWFFLGINDVLGVGVKWIDKWLILALLPAAQFAIYFNGTYEIPIFLLLLSAVGNIALVDMAKLDLINFIAIKKIFYQSTLLLAAIIIPSFCLLLFNGDTLIRYLFSEKYEASIPIFQLSILILPTRVVYSTLLLQTFHKSNLIVKGAIIDFIVAIIFILTLYPIYKLEGMALAFVISTYIQVGYYLWQSGKMLQKKVTEFIPFKSMFLMLSISLFVYWIANYFLKNYSDITILVCAILIGIINTFLFLFYKNRFLQKVFPN